MQRSSGLFRTIRESTALAREIRTAPDGLQLVPQIPLSDLPRIIFQLYFQNPFAVGREIANLAAEQGILYLPFSNGMSRRGMIVINQPELADEFFKKSTQQFERGNDFRLLRYFLGQSILTMDRTQPYSAGSADETNRTWEMQRRLLTPLFRRERIDAAKPEVETLIEQELQMLTGSGHASDAIDLHRFFKSTTLKIIGRYLFGYSFSESEVTEITDSVREASRILNDHGAAIATFARSFDQQVADPAFYAAVQRIDAIVRRIIDARLARRQRTPQEPLEQSNAIDVLIGSLRPEAVSTGVLSPEEFQLIRDETLTLIFAGHETTANSLAWTWSYLLRSPQELARLEAELPLNIPSLERVHQEGLRLEAPVDLFARRAIPSATPIILGRTDHRPGFYIPSETLVFLTPNALHRQTHVWGETAESFSPERFNEASTARPRGSFCPFANGGHTCIGMTLALAEMRWISLALIRNFEIAPVNQTPPTRSWGITLEPAEGVWVRLNHRGSRRM